mgnify:FL=1
MILLSSFIVSFSIIYCPYYFIVKSTKKTQPYAYIKLSIKNIPMKEKDIKVNLIDKKDLKLKLKPKILNNEYQYLSDSKISLKLLKKKPSQINVQDKIIAREENTKKLTNIHFVNQKNIADDKDSVIHQSVVVRLADTINKSFLYNPKIKAQKKLFESSKENINQVQSNYFPSIDLNVSKGFSKVDSASATRTAKERRSPQDISINLTQNLYSGGKISAEIKKAKNQYLIEEENFKLVKQEVILESAEVFLELLEQKKLIELNKLKEHRFTKDLESIELLFKVGKASQSDLIFVKSELIKIVAEKIASINKLEFIEIKYKSIVGDFIPKSQLEEPKFKNINLPENYVTAETIALKNNPKYRKLLIEEKISKNEVRSQFADALPNITLDAEYRTADDFSSKGSSSDTAEITAELTIPLFRGGKNLSKIKQAKLIAKKVRYDLENKKNETIQEVKNSWLNYKTFEINLKSATISYEAKKLILEGIEQEAKLGMRSYIDVLKSKEDLIDAEFEKIKANHQLILSALKLKANIGELSLKNLDI